MNKWQQRGPPGTATAGLVVIDHAIDHLIT
jgi:hypothetical protein